MADPVPDPLPPESADVLVSGGTGLIGRWVLADLTAQGRHVAAIVRGAERRDAELRRWVDAHGGDGARLHVVEGDLGRADLGLGADRAWLRRIRTLFSFAGRIEFGMGVDEARAVNVTGALALLDAAAAGGLDRVVHVSGYRVGGMPAEDPLPATLYEERGAYEASKMEADWAIRRRAAELGVPWTILNPSTVVGDSRTGETTQLVGLASTLRDLFDGRLPALVGGPRVLLPIVAVDYVAAFAIAAAAHPEAADRSYWILDEATPRLPDLIREVADHTGVRAPGLNLPTSLVRRMPKALTKVEPDSLEFLVPDDDYPTESARELARGVGLAMPDVSQTLRRWVDHLVATRFLEATPALAGGFEDVGGTRTFVRRRGGAAQLVCLHGLPLDGDSWLDVLELLGEEAVVPDLPGLARSAPSSLDPAAWLSQLASESPSVIVGHSLGCEYAVRFAAARPDRVRGLVLVSPFFLQAPPPPPLRAWPLVAMLLRRASVDRLRASMLEGAPGAQPALASAAANLRRRGVAGRTARRLAAAGSPGRRKDLRAALASLDLPVAIVHGSKDPLVAGEPGQARVTAIEGAGHNPQLTHAAEVAAAIRAAGG